MKKIVVCKKCGGTVTRRVVDDGYLSGADLGRARGAKGIDLSHIEYDCVKCGRNVEAIEVEKKEWFDELEGQTIAGLTVSRGWLLDEYGNTLFGLPKERPENLEAWIADKAEEWLEYGE